jgi:hypothetical protein
MDIDTWLDDFKKYWEHHDVEGVLGLFKESVEYYETPFIKLANRSELCTSWNEILLQENIQLKYAVFTASVDKFSVLWNLTYTKNGETKRYAGTYLIILNEQNLCTYFFHCCEGSTVTT